VVARLRQHYPDLASRFKVSSLALFGSFARDEQTSASDVDLLVSFSEPVGFAFIHLTARASTPSTGKRARRGRPKPSPRPRSCGSAPSPKRTPGAIASHPSPTPTRAAAGRSASTRRSP
jgi:hypothetical protein